jgi:hypothetical protein
MATWDYARALSVQGDFSLRNARLYKDDRNKELAFGRVTTAR